MKLVHPENENQIEFRENRVQVWKIENQNLYSSFVQELYNQIEYGQEGRFILSMNNEIIDISKKAFICINPFDLDFNSKKIINKLYSELKSIIYEDDMYLETNKILSELQRYYAMIADNIEYELEFNLNIEPLSILKLGNMKICKKSENMLEYINDYINIMQKLFQIDLCVLVNAKSYLAIGELEKLYKECHYKKINLLLIEGGYGMTIKELEDIYIIDENCCEIYK